MLEDGWVFCTQILIQFRLQKQSFHSADRPYAMIMDFFHFVTKKFVLKSYGEIPEGKVWNALVEEKLSVRALKLTHQIMFKRISTSVAAELLLLGSDAADIQFPYLFNVIWWVMFRARTLDFSWSKGLQTLPFGISP